MECFDIFSCTPVTFLVPCFGYYWVDSYQNFFLIGLLCFHWSPVIVYIATFKTDNMTHCFWLILNTSLENFPQFPTVEQVFRVLKKKSLVLYINSCLKKYLFHLGRNSFRLMLKHSVFFLLRGGVVGIHSSRYYTACHLTLVGGYPHIYRHRNWGLIDTCSGSGAWVTDQLFDNGIKFSILHCCLSSKHLAQEVYFGSISVLNVI